MPVQFDQQYKDLAQQYLDAQNGVPRGTTDFQQTAPAQGFGGVFEAIDQNKAAQDLRAQEAASMQPVKSAADFDALAQNLQQQPQQPPADGMQLTSMGGGQAPALASDVVNQNPRQESPAQSQAFNQLNNIEDAYSMQQMGIIQAANAGAQRAAAEASYFQQQQKEMERVQAEQAAREADRQARLEAETSKLNQSIEEYGNLQIDPGRLWKNKSTGEKVGTAIALILGAFGARDGKGNRAAEVVQNSINQDIDAQKADIQVKGDKINAQKSLYGQMLSRFGDERQAESATRLAILQNSQLKAQEIASKYKAPEIQANAQVLYGQLEAQKQQEIAKFQQASMARLVSFEAQQNPEGINPNMLSKEDRERFVPGYGLALTAKGAEEMNAAVIDANNAKAGIKDLLALSEKTGKSLTPEDRSRAETLAGVLQGNLRTFLVGPGAVSDSERKLLESIIANPTRIFSLDSQSRASLQTLMGSIDRSLDHRAQANNLKSRAAVRDSLGVAAPVRVSK